MWNYYNKIPEAKTHDKRGKKINTMFWRWQFFSLSSFLSRNENAQLLNRDEMHILFTWHQVNHLWFISVHIIHLLYLSLWQNDENKNTQCVCVNEYNVIKQFEIPNEFHSLITHKVKSQCPIKYIKSVKTHLMII